MRSRRVLGALVLLVVAILMLGSTSVESEALETFGPQIPTLIAPIGNVNDRTPEFTWTKKLDTTLYQIQVKQGGITIYLETVDASVCGATECSYEPSTLLDYGDYIWRARAFAQGAWHPMTDYKSFTVIRPILKQPLGTIVDPTPRYVWLKEIDATQYQLQLLKGTTTIYTKTVNAAVCGVTNCLYTPTNVLSPGDYKWRLRAVAGGVWGGWTAAYNFRVIEDPSFFSDFNTNMDGWSAITGNWRIAGSKVLKTEGVLDQFASVYYQDNNFANFRYQVKMKRAATGCSTCPTGFIIRGGIQPLGTQSLWNQGYLFAYSNSGTVAVYRMDGGSIITLLTATPSTAVVQNGWNTLRVDAIGSGLKFYVNNELVYSGVDANYTIGKIGITMFNNSSAGNALYVDWASASYRNPTTLMPIME